MNRPTHRQALWAGLAILFAVNAIALGGAAWNRSQVDSQPHLSERELSTPYAWQSDSEDSGVSLGLRWRARPAAASTTTDYFSMYGDYGSDPGWLDATKLAELGFTVTPPNDGDESRDWRRRARSVTLVLELDGAAYAQSLALAVEVAENAKLKSTAAPNDKALTSQAKEAADNLRHEQARASRLFAVDAGRDRDRLRAKYPDRQRYVLVQAMVQIYWQRSLQKQWQVVGSIERLMNPQIHLSRAQASALAPAMSGTGAQLYGEDAGKPFEVELAYGRRLEPWVVSARVR